MYKIEMKAISSFSW